MIKSATLLLALIFLTTGATAQNKQFDEKSSLVSDVDFSTTNTGLFGLNVAKKGPGFTVPRGSKKSYLFGSGLWFGARKRVLDSSGVPVWRPLAFLAYNPSTAVGWGTPGEASDRAPPAPPSRARSSTGRGITIGGPASRWLPRTPPSSRTGPSGRT